MWAAILQSIAQHAVFHTVQFGVGEVVVSYSGHCTSHLVRYGGGGGVRTHVGVHAYACGCK